METLPQLETERLILRSPCAGDIADIVEYANNPVIAETTLNIPHPYTEQDAINWLSKGYLGFSDKSEYSFGIEVKATGTFIGGIGLKVNKRFNRAEIGYWLGEPFWNQGFGTEALKPILKFGFESLMLHKIEAHYLVTNVASGRIMDKNGMIREGELIEHVKKDDQYLSLIQYRLTKTEYETLINN